MSYKNVSEMTVCTPVGSGLNVAYQQQRVGP